MLTTAHCEEHAELVLEKSVQRQLILTATEIVQASYDESRRATDLVEEAEQRIAPILLSFMSESRRLVNTRMKRELRVRLKYETPQQLLTEIAPRDLKKQLALPL